MDERFTLLQVPKVLSGPGSLRGVSAELAGRHVLCLVSPSASSHRAVVEVFDAFEREHIGYYREQVSGEPTVEVIDTITERYRGEPVDTVLGIGGGSVLDAAKAVSAMLLHRKDPAMHDASVIEYLEGVGDRTAPAGRIGLVLVPTTAGTGSEATKNAVLTRVGTDGFKKSLRHDSYVCDLAVLDPLLLDTVPLSVLIPSGMDALTQLLEAYFSVSTNRYIDSLVIRALEYMPYALMGLLEKSGRREDHLSTLSYGAFISGVGLAHAGLGYVHGLSGPMGAIHRIPHGVACALLIAKTNRAMFDRAVAQGDADEYLTRLHRLALAWDLTGPEQAIELLERLELLAQLPPASAFGFTREDMDTLDVVKAQRNAPVTIPPSEVKDILYSII